jgi:hypothetical protein
MNGKPEHVKLWKLIRLRWPSASGSISEPVLHDPVSYPRQRVSSASWCGRSSAILAVPPKPLRLTKMPVDMYRSINAMVSVAPEHSRSRTALAFPAAGRGNLTACLARSQPSNGSPAAAEDAGRLGSTQVNCSREAIPFCLSFELPVSWINHTSCQAAPRIRNVPSTNDQKSLISSSND